MKSLLILALCIISLTQIKSQGISREWLSDWQNQAISGCYPDSFTISGTGTDSSPYIIQYDFPADNYWLVCYEYAHGGVAGTSNLYSYSTDVYTDSNYNIILTYDPTTESVSASFYNQPKPFLYTIDGTSIQQQAALGNIGRTWSNKSPASGNSGNCCVPDSIFIALANPQFYLLAEFNAMYYYNTTNCAKNSTYNYQLSVANPVSLNWAGSNVSNPSGLIDQIALTPDEFSEQWTFLLTANNGTCNYTYTPVNTRAHPSYSYVQDWQTTPDKYSPSSYAVTTESGAYSDFDYMVSTVTLPNGTSYKSYLVENPQGLYFDPYVNINGTYFSFDSDTYSLLSVSTNPATEDALLLSTSGSIFTATDFESGWTSAVSTNGEALPSDCCIPSYIAIAANETEKNELSVIYYFDSDYLNNTGCQDIQYSIYNYQLESTLSIETPSVTQLVWTDLYGHQIFFTYPTETDEIQVSNFLGQCSFNMIPTSTAPPTPPAPSSASVISIGTMTLVSGLLIIFNLF